MKTQLPSKYPWKYSREPQGVREPQVGNHWFKPTIGTGRDDEAHTRRLAKKSRSGGNDITTNTAETLLQCFN